MDQLKFFRNRILPYWKTYIVILAPLLLAPLISLGKESRAGYVILIMAIYWTTEAIPLPVTALLPVVLFPLFGIMDTGKVCTAYMKETNVMFIGGLILGLTIEYCNLHRRIALHVLMIAGAKTRWLMLGFMATTAFLSMWISNTATTAMMVPIVDAVVEELFKDDEDVNDNNDGMVRIVPDGSSTLSSADSNDSINLDCLNEDAQHKSIGSANSLDSVRDSVLDRGLSQQQLTIGEDNQWEVHDATAVMGIIMLLFIIPAKPRFWRCFRPTGEIDDKETPSSSLLDWKYAQDKLPWGIVLLLGGGFALSDASQISGLSKWLGLQLTGLQVLHPFFIMLIVCIITATITEEASNTATANILLPILSELAVSIRINPLFLMLPATVTCSYAFMLPVATPPNAIVYSTGHMSSVDMMKPGFLMNIICVFVICIFTYSYGTYLFDFNEFPSWALKNSTDTLSMAMSSSAMNCSCEP